MLVDLVQTTTRDGVRLDGMFRAPTARAPAVPVDGFCLVHGTGGNFYGSSLLGAFGERLLALGCAVLTVNTRGHEGISSAVTDRGGRRQGAAYEVVDDCRHDLAAWLAWLRQRAGPRVGLVGHSMGAVKCLYALAQEPQPGVACVLALSPPRLSYAWFCAGPKAAEFLQTYQEAERSVGTGRPDALLDVKFPLPFVITAAGYVEKYGPEERYNFLRFVGGVPCPTLITLGALEVESNAAFRGSPEALRPLTERYPWVQVRTVAGADHFYTNARDDVIAQAEAWLRTLPVTPATA
ncbi:MAG TPA: alpha/beta fold hydrolase [Gemmataceae bacterium]|nr:alpha/beta fold hydrolase [Gemmataceae bacterium]